jgi:hypothetical protein
MKRLIPFLLGVTFGIFVTIARFYYDVFSKPVLPSVVEVDSNGYVVSEDRAYYANGKPKSVPWREAMGMPPKPTAFDIQTTVEALRGRIQPVDPTDKTQPIKVKPDIQEYLGWG